MILYPNAKINIGLNILKKKDDGYHEISSIFYPIVDLYDILEIIPSDSFSFTTSGISVNEKNNICIEAYELLSKDFNFGSVKMHLNKRIPIGAGLGGGSSDASFVIKGLNKIFDLGLTVNQLELYALKLGADCPFFIDNTPKHVTGVGENMSNIDVDLSNFNIKLHFSKKHISTSYAYSIINPVDKNYNLPSLVNNHISKWKNYIKNDFEVPIFLENPELAAVKNDFYSSGAIYSSMSGTGSAVYAIFEKTTHS